MTGERAKIALVKEIWNLVETKERREEN